MKGETLAILTSGGDAPGMNATIRAITLVAVAEGAKVLGVEHGYRGLIRGEFRELTPEDVTSIAREGGTILGSTRFREFENPDVRQDARQKLSKKGVKYLIVIGGNGSLTGAHFLCDPNEAKDAPRLVGIPASIDNDIGYTGMSIGVDTALNTIVEACDKINDTAESHDRTFIVEVMGRDCGYLAMTSAIATEADIVLFPEANMGEEQLVKRIVDTIIKVRSRGGRKHRVLVISAEGISLRSPELKQRVDEALAASHSEEVKETETRLTVLGHVVRGGRPSAFDRLLGSRLGNAAVRILADGQNRRMVSWLPPTPPPEDVAQRSSADPYCWSVDLAAALEETQRLIHGASPLARWRATVFDELEDLFIL